MPTLVYTELHVYMRLPTHITGLWVTQLISRLISDDAHAYLMLALVPVVTVQNPSQTSNFHFQVSFRLTLQLSRQTWYNTLQGLLLFYGDYQFPGILLLEEVN